jgi:pimeloyl-ACP methyl ester carboxylesterase
MADDVAEVIRQLGAGRAAVLGHAFGNGVARLLATTYQDVVEGAILAAASTDGASRETNETPFIAGDPSRPESERLEALRRGFFAPHHDPRPWLEGWYPVTLQKQKEAVHSAKPELFSKAGAASILQIIAESDPFSPYDSWRALRNECGDRVTARIVADASHALFPEQPLMLLSLSSTGQLGSEVDRNQPVALKEPAPRKTEAAFGTRSIVDLSSRGMQTSGYAKY